MDLQRELMNDQAPTDALVRIVAGFNKELAAQLAAAIGRDRSAAYYRLRDAREAPAKEGAVT
jgi:hypothetical protein